MLEETLNLTVQDDGKTDLSLKNHNGVFSISGKTRQKNISDWDKNLISPDHFNLFHVLLSYVNLGKFNVRVEVGVVFVEFIYS